MNIDATDLQVRAGSETSLEGLRATAGPAAAVAPTSRLSVSPGMGVSQGRVGMALRLTGGMPAACRPARCAGTSSACDAVGWRHRRHDDRLALVFADAGPREFVAEQEFRSADFEGLQPIVEAFLASSGERPGSACFDVAGPVIAGYAHLTNLPWNLKEAALCRHLGLDRITLLNDLEAIAHAVPHLQREEMAEINAGCAVAHSPIAVLAPGTGLGEAFLIWSGQHYAPAPPKAATSTSRQPIRSRPACGRS